MSISILSAELVGYMEGRYWVRGRERLGSSIKSLKNRNCTYAIANLSRGDVSSSRSSILN